MRVPWEIGGAQQDKIEGSAWGITHNIHSTELANDVTFNTKVTHVYDHQVSTLRLDSLLLSMLCLARYNHSSCTRMPRVCVRSTGGHQFICSHVICKRVQPLYVHLIEPSVVCCVLPFPSTDTDAATWCKLAKWRGKRGDCRRY